MQTTVGMNSVHKIICYLVQSTFIFQRCVQYVALVLLITQTPVLNRDFEAAALNLLIPVCVCVSL